MIALFVTIETREPGPEPIRASASASAASSAARVAAISAAVALRLTSWTSPSIPPCRTRSSPRPPGTGSARARAAAARGRARRRRTPRGAPARLRPTRRRRGRLEPVERRRDHVEVGGLGGVLPRRSGRASPRSCERRVGRRRNRVRVGDCVAAARRARGVAEVVSAASMRRVAAASRASRSDSRSAKAPAAPSRNVIASWISKSSATLPSLTPRPYSIGTSLRKRSSWPARRSCSRLVSGAARKPSSARSDCDERTGAPRRRLAREPRAARASPSPHASPRHRAARGRRARGSPSSPRRTQPPRPRDRRTRALGLADGAERRADPAVVRVEQVACARAAAAAGVIARPRAGRARASRRLPRARSASAGGTRARAATSAPPRRRHAASAAIASANAAARIVVQTSARAAARPARRAVRRRRRRGRAPCVADAQLGRPAGEHDLSRGARLGERGARGAGVAEHELGLGVREREPRRRRAVHGAALPRRASGEHEARRDRHARRASRRTALLHDLDLQPRSSLGDLAGDRRRALLRVAAEHVGLLRA